ncbi:hypothetical protein PIIN_10925 [Serendipita indica DSM 11827]|uniref:Uncharacterized protein n=1 Tax=Serendipita indica (strain DSM 11827) TaxID=1109443 RepID=G4U049_SERID|nr:hypothetical protein PIIN_10925 [Serendipita indica DSM 11827]
MTSGNIHLPPADCWDRQTSDWLPFQELSSPIIEEAERFAVLATQSLS